MDKPATNRQIISEPKNEADRIPKEFKKEVNTLIGLLFHPRNFEHGDFYDKYFAARILKYFIPTFGDLNISKNLEVSRCAVPGKEE